MSDVLEAALVQAERALEQSRAMFRETVAAHQAGLYLVAWKHRGDAKAPANDTSSCQI